MRLVVLAVLTVALAGCGSATTSSLEDAAEATAAETSRFEMSFRHSEASGRGAYEFNAVGAFDYPNELAAMTVSGLFPFLAEEVVLKEVRLIGPTTYMRWAIKGKEYWIKDEAAETGSHPNDLLIPLPGSPTKPTDVLERVLAASDGTEVLGTDTVRGVETTRYRARVDLEKLVKELPPSERRQDDVVEMSGAGFVPVELWIDDESRLRRITIALTAYGGEETTSVELYDYGVQVDVEPPSGEELMSQEEFDKLIDPLMKLEVEEGGEEPVLPEEVCEEARKEQPAKEADRLCRDMRAEE
jgi:LppX_LprAFG lipoprotein